MVFVNFRRVVSVVLLLMSPALVLWPAGLDALLIHAHAHEELHAHAIVLSGTQLTHDEHDHDKHLPGLSLSTSVDGTEFVVVFSKLLVPSSATPLRIVPATERPVPPWVEPLGSQEESNHARLLFETGLPPPYLHGSLSKTAALLRLNHALLL